MRPPRVKTFSSLAHRDYRFLFAGNFFANGAQWLQLLTVGWLVFEKLTNGSAILSGTVVGIRTLPVLLIGPWAGVLADRVDRRKLIMATQTCLALSAAVFAYLVATNEAHVWHAFLYIAVAGVCYAIIQPVRQTLIANTVPRQDLPNAYALFAMTITSTRLAAPLIGALLIKTAGYQWNFFLEAGAYVAIILLTIPMKTPYKEESTARQSSVAANLKEGFLYTWRDKIILRLIILNFVPNFVIQPLSFLLPVYTTEALHAGAGTGGVLLAAMGVGGVVATVMIASGGWGFNRGLVTMAAVSVGCGAFILFAQSHWLSLSLAAVVVLGFTNTNFRVGNGILVQTLVPDTVRGRVMSIYQFDQGLTPLAILVLSIFVHFTGVAFALTIAGAIGLALSTYFLLTFREVRQLA